MADAENHGPMASDQRGKGRLGFLGPARREPLEQLTVRQPRDGEPVKDCPQLARHIRLIHSGASVLARSTPLFPHYSRAGRQSLHFFSKKSSRNGDLVCYLH